MDILKVIYKFVLPESSGVSGCKFPEFILFDTLVKLGFYTFIIPFRFHKSGKVGSRYELKSNPVHLSISTILMLGSSIYSFFSIRLLFTMDLKKNPSEIFAVIYGMMRACYPSLWFYTFWGRRISFNKLLMVCQTSSSPSAYLVTCLSSRVPLEHHHPHHVENPTSEGVARDVVDWKIAVLVKLCILLAFAKLGIETWLYYQEPQTTGQFFDTVLGFNGGSSLFNLYPWDKEPRNMSRAEVFHSWDQTLLTFSVLLFGMIHDYIANLAGVFCLVGAGIMLSICGRFTALIPKVGEGSSNVMNPAVLEKDTEESMKFLKTLEKLSTFFVEVGKVADASNEIFGPIFLLYVLGAFPSLAGFMIFKQHSHITGEKHGWMAMAYEVTMYTLVSMIASEASSQMVDYKCWLFDVSLLRKKSLASGTSGLAPYHQDHQEPLPRLSTPVLSKINHLHREVASDSVGLKGGSFFTMSHGVIGTMLGIFVTFAIVIVQFEMDVAKKNESNS